MEQIAQAKKPPSTIERNSFRFKINLSSDQMVAHLAIQPLEKDQIFSFEKDELYEIINSLGVLYGLDDEAIEKLTIETPINKPVEIARGKPAGQGNDAGFELLFETAGSKAPVVGADGYIDYKNLNLISNAAVGQHLAKKIHASQGEPGITVTGKQVPGKMGKDRALPRGKNTEISPDNPELLIASMAGAITFSNNIISIDSMYKIASDVDISTGNIDFVGSLKIVGAVRAGFRVKAMGNIEIGNNIEDSEIISGGSVAATGGFVGSGKGSIRAAEDVFVKYVENQTIEAGHDVNIGGGAMNANVTAGNSVILKGRKAVILGGSIAASNLIEANEIGSEMGTPTLVRVGYNRALIEELKKIEQEITRLKADGEKIHKAMYTLVRLEIDNKLNESQKQALLQLKEQQVIIPGQCEKLEIKKAEIIRRLNENKKARIVVKGAVYPGAVIQVGMLKREIEKTISNCTFGADQDKIVIISRN